jgi:protocatechuate 4,5-dioxygenase alpha subunit
MRDVEIGKFHRGAAQKGYALNQMCYSLNSAQNRAAYAADPDAYCRRYGLSDEERVAALSRDKAKLANAGGNMYFFAKLDRAFRPAKKEG